MTHLAAGLVSLVVGCSHSGYRARSYLHLNPIPRELFGRTDRADESVDTSFGLRLLGSEGGVKVVIMDHGRRL